MAYSADVEKLTKLCLYDDYFSNHLTILRLAYALDLNFSQVQKKLYKKGFPECITYETKVDDDWLHVILTFNRKRSSNKTRRHKPKKSSKKSPELINTIVPNDKVSRLNTGRRKGVVMKKNEIVKPKFINVPMGGKVK